MKKHQNSPPLGGLSPYDKLIILVHRLHESDVLIRINVKTGEVSSFLSQSEIKKIDEILSTLSNFEKKVICLNLGFSGAPAMTYKEIANKLDKSASRIGQIFNKGIKKLSHPSRKNLLPNPSKSAFDKRLLELEQRELEISSRIEQQKTYVKKETIIITKKLLNAKNAIDNCLAHIGYSLKLATPTDELELSIRTHTLLRDANIKTVGDLVEKTEAQMLKTKNFGRKNLGEIKSILSEMNLSFGMKF